MPVLTGLVSFGFKTAKRCAISVVMAIKLFSPSEREGMGKVRHSSRTSGVPLEEIPLTSIILFTRTCSPSTRQFAMLGNISCKAALAAANKRVQNLLKKADSQLGEINKALLTQNEEQALFQAAQALQPKIAAAVIERNFSAALSELASVKPQVDAFFDSVMVMAEDPAVKQNRLNLLNQLAQLMNAVADIALLQE